MRKICYDLVHNPRPVKEEDTENYDGDYDQLRRPTDRRFFLLDGKMFDNQKYGFLTIRGAITLLNRLYNDNVQLTHERDKEEKIK